MKSYSDPNPKSSEKKAVAFLVRENGFYQPILECGHKYRLIKVLRLDKFYCYYCWRRSLHRRYYLDIYRKYDKRPRKYYSKVGHPVVGPD